MTLKEWSADAFQHLAEDGLVRGGRKATYEFYLGMWRQLGRRINYGRRVYEHDWDLLVVLDACRADLMAEVADEYSFLTRNAVYSCASSSGEWTQKNFSGAYAEEREATALVSANPYTDEHLDADDFLLLDEVWRDSFDRDIRTVRAEAVTDRAIGVHRDHDPDRMIAHYMQPHYPFVPDPIDEGLAMHEYDGSPWDTVWEKLQKNDVSREEVWRGYRENLRYVLDHVEVLLRSVDAQRAIITADHGNLLGEFGLYGHPQYVPVPALKRVPWVVTEASDDGEYSPNEQRSTDVSLEEQLEALGYR